MGELTSSLEANIQVMKNAFLNDVTFKFRRVENPLLSIKGAIFYIEGMASGDVITEGIVTPILWATCISKGKELMQAVTEDIICAPELSTAKTITELSQKIASGDCALLLEGCAEALIVGAKGFAMRSVSEPDNERIIKGPREGFCESVMVNTSLMRRRIQNNDIKFEFQKLGDVYSTTVCISYIESCVDKKVLEEIKKRLKKVQSSAILDSNYIAEQIKDRPYSPLKTIGTTERPDIAVAKMLEGRICILVDGSPVCLTAPHLFLELFQSSEDYYVNFYYTSFARIIRMLGFFLSISLPAMYIALVCFSQELLPTSLALSIAKSRANLPFSTITEAAALLIIFDVLRESGARSPSNMGQALSVVSSIVLGQAAIEAGFVSSPMLIIIAFSGVTSVLVPKISGMTVLSKYVLLGVAGVFGMSGVGLALFLILAYICSLDSFGVPYTSFFYADRQEATKDTFFRVSWKELTATPIFKGESSKKGEAK